MYAFKGFYKCRDSWIVVTDDVHMTERAYVRYPFDESRENRIRIISQVRESLKSFDQLAAISLCCAGEPLGLVEMVA